MQTVKLTSRREVAPAVYELLFTRPEGWTFEAGQFARIGLAADGDEPVFRAYSIAGSPKAEGLRFLVKSVEGGALSPRLCALNPGDEVLLDGEAQGNLLPARIPGGDTVWMLATGSGLAPFIAMTGDEGTLGAWKKHILVIGARTREEVARQAAYAESVQWVLDHPAEAAALAEEHLGMKAAVVEAAIPNMGLTFKSAQDAWGELDTFYNLLNDFDPSMIGGKLPDDGLYYAG